MADDSNKRGQSVRSRLASEEPYELADFAQKHSVSVAEKLIGEIGDNRSRFDASAVRLRSS
jgi:hypothetical protein